MSTTAPFPGPYPLPETEPYWEAAADGRLLLASCDDCERPFLYPRMVCPLCWGERLRWVEAAGGGVVETLTVVHRAGHPAFAPLTPYVCAVVRLDEGPRLMTNLVGPRALAARVGDRVAITTVARGGRELPVAEPFSRPTPPEGSP